MKKNPSGQLLLPYLAGAVAFVLPLVSTEPYIMRILTTIFIFASLGVAWNLVGGYAGQLSLGQSAFFGIGAYTAVLFYLKLNLTPLLGGLMGAGLAVLAAVLIGLPTFRLRGAYFSLATIAFAEILRILLMYFRDFTGGANGISLSFKGNQPWMLQFYSPVPYYYIALFLLIAAVGAAWRIERAKFGRYLAAIRENQEAAESIGVNSGWYKLLAFIISAVITSLLGVFYAFYIGFVDPDMVVGLDLSIRIAVTAIVGGIGYLWGPVVGAIVLIPLAELASTLWGGARAGANLAFYGFLLMIVVLFRPQGMLSLFTEKGGSSH